MRLGFIGTGKIASSVIIGICNSKIKYKQIIDKKKRLLFCTKEVKRLSLRLGIRLKYKLKLYEQVYFVEC